MFLKILKKSNFIKIKLNYSKIGKYFFKSEFHEKPIEINKKTLKKLLIHKLNDPRNEHRWRNRKRLSFQIAGDASLGSTRFDENALSFSIR